MPNIYHDDELKSGAACSDGTSGGTGAALTPGLLPINHEEARELATLNKDASNLARCYLDLSMRLSEAKSDEYKIAYHAGLNREIELVTELSELRDYAEGLKRFAKHDDDCSIHARSFERMCDCGLDDLLASERPQMGVKPMTPAELRGAWEDGECPQQRETPPASVEDHRCIWRERYEEVAALVLKDKRPAVVSSPKYECNCPNVANCKTSGHCFRTFASLDNVTVTFSSATDNEIQKDSKQ